MSNYGKLRAVSSERFAEPSSFSSIDDISDFRISMLMPHASLIGGSSRNVPSGGPGLGFILEKRRQYLKMHGVERVKKALMLFAVFDKNMDPHALPLFPPADGEALRHSDIIMNYRGEYKAMFEDVKFPIRPDALGGEMYVIKDQKPVIALHQGKERLPSVHMEALDRLSVDLPEVNIALSRAATTFIVFDEGKRSEFTIDT